MNEEQIQAACAAFKQDPETACKALLGCSAEELFITALRGCNQHAHKPGCPDATGGISGDDFDRIFKAYAAKNPEARKQEREAQLKRTLRDYQNAVGQDASDSEAEKLWEDHEKMEALYNALEERLQGSETKLKAALATQKKAKEAAEKNYSKENKGFLNAATERVNKYKKQIAESVVSSVDSMYNSIYSTWQNKGTEFLRKAEVNIADASAAYSNARGAALFIKNTPSSERWEEALSDMKKGSEELQQIYKKLGLS